MEDNQNGSRSALGSLFFFLILVAIIAAGVYYAPELVPQPKIGVVRVNYDIFSVTAGEFTQQMDYARNNEDIRAVVLIINSPGGSASYSEEMYLDVLSTREEIPVIASIDLLAASGAYFTAAAADEIYAKPTSFVGSIGVIASFPGPVFIDDSILTTGPYKLFGGTKDGTVRQVEMAKLTFLEAVKIGRGDRLVASLEELSRAEIYSGVQAERMGLIDGLISTDDAIKRAAELANISNYEVVELYPLTFEQEDAVEFGYEPEPINAEKLWAAPTDLAPGLYYRFVANPITN